ncbi:MAG: hypothetical protein WCU80_01850 [Paludibacteraceae bacterium]
MRRLFALFTMAVVSVCLYSQTPEEWNVPQNYSLVNAEDYAPYNEDVVKCVDWLVNTPLDLQTSKRRDAHKFLMAWISGSPEVMVIVSEDLVPFFESGDLLLVFMGGWSKYSIRTGEYKDKIGGAVAGLEASISLYEKNRSMLSDSKPVVKSMTNLVKLRKKGKLKEFVEENIAKNVKE